MMLEESIRLQFISVFKQQEKKNDQNLRHCKYRNVAFFPQADNISIPTIL